MKTQNLSELLRHNPYPGRGVLLGNSEDGNKSVMAYFIMGRSENSRNRVFVPTGDGIETKAFDESKMTDPSLIIYAPVRVIAAGTVVTNGDQTDTIADTMAAGGTFEAALRTRVFEPDKPNYTPRISGIVYGAENRYTLSILKSGDGDPAAVRRYFYEYTGTPAGEGHLIHTYQGDGNPLPSFEGEPVKVALSGGIKTFGDRLWDSLNAENKISLFVRYLDRRTGEFESVLYNKYQ